MRKITLASLTLGSLVLAEGVGVAASLGAVNMNLSGNVIDFTCVVETGSDNKTVQLGSWQTNQLPTTGSSTQEIPFSLRLTGCPPSGTASITFSGKNTGSGLLALNDTSTAKNVAVELHNEDKTRLLLGEASKEVDVDAEGNVTLNFWANYIATADKTEAGKAYADATFMINYE